MAEVLDVSQITLHGLCIPPKRHIILIPPFLPLQKKRIFTSDHPAPGSIRQDCA